VATLFGESPDRHVASADGTPIALFSTGVGPPLLLVHGTTADHRTWRVVGPLLAARWRLHAIDRRGRGDSGDAARYVIERELEDVAAVATVLAGEAGRPVDVVGHSLGGRIALGASVRAASLRRIVAYESAPVGTDADAKADQRLLARLRAGLAAGDLEGMLAEFMTDGVGMPPDDLAAFRADPIWPRRVAAAGTIVRELEASRHAPAIALTELGTVTIPVLQLVGSESPPTFRRGAVALDRLLADGRLTVIEGARHAAHHSHPRAFVAAVERFLER
jgi:pimeloyl-ACP methyl ester carboxylesterase